MLKNATNKYINMQKLKNKYLAQNLLLVFKIERREQ